MKLVILMVVLISALSAAFAGQAFALGCNAPTPTPGHTFGSTGYTDIPTTPCPVGHYAGLQRKRTNSALFAQPTNPTPTTPDPQTNTRTNAQP